MLFRVLLYGLLLYLSYKLVFELIIPVYKTSKKIKKGFREMQEQMNQQQHSSTTSPPKPPPQKKAGDYIDFEEMK